MRVGATSTSPDEWPIRFDDPNSPGVNEDPNAARYIEKLASSDAQFVEVDKETDKPLTVRVTDQRHRPVSGALVVFRVQLGDGQVKAENGGWGSEALATSDENGRASASFKPAKKITLGTEVYLEPSSDQFPSFVGVNQVAARAESPPDQGAQILAGLRDPFQVFAKPAAVKELVTWRKPYVGFGGNARTPSAFEADWLIIARDEHQNTVSNAEIRISSEVEPAAASRNCNKAEGSGLPMYFLKDECAVDLLPIHGSCGTAEKTLMSSTTRDENPVFVINGQLFGATYRAIANSNGAPPLVLEWGNFVLGRSSPALSARSGSPTRAVH